MKFIILSGGSGKRLWPLSTEKKPKQLLSVLSHNEKTESMLQRIVRQLLVYVEKEDIIVTTTKLQLEELQKQIKDLPIICEPETRDTFPAIALATLYLRDELKCSQDEVVAVISADTFVDQSFFERIIELQDVVKRTSAPLGLVGIQPSYPSTRFGYIERDDKTDIFTVKRFTEKPTEEIAINLIERGALWNSGIFVFPLRTVVEQLRQFDSIISYEVALKNFKQMPKLSFDYAIVEKLDNIICTTYGDQWDDLGTWESLLRKMNTKYPHVRMTEDCNDVRVINELNMPIKVIGVSNLTVVATKHGILISDTKSSGRLKELTD